MNNKKRSWAKMLVLLLSVELVLSEGMIPLQVYAAPHDAIIEEEDLVIEEIPVSGVEEVLQQSAKPEEDETVLPSSDIQVAAETVDVTTGENEEFHGGYIEMPWDNDTPTVDDDLSYADAIAGIVDEYPGVWIPDSQNYVSAPTQALQAKFPEADDEEGILAYLTANYPHTRRQNPYGNCWAHSAVALAEFYMIKHNLKDIKYDAPVTKDVNYSELQLAYFCYHNSSNPHGSTDDTVEFYNGAVNFLDFGGNLGFASQSLMRYNGVAPEVNGIAYSDAKSILENGLEEGYAHYYNQALLKNAYQINIKNNPDIAKQAILENGIIGVSFYWDGAYLAPDEKSFYNWEQSDSNHAVAIVGWDDNYDKTNFKEGHQPENDGAWLVRNSWSTENAISADSYFWLSYEDRSLNVAAYVFEMADKAAGEVYDNNYYYDSQLHSVCEAPSNKVANVYTVHGYTEILKAVSFDVSMPTVAPGDYTVTIYKDLTDVTKPESGTLVDTITGTLPFAGKYTIPLTDVAVGTKLYEGETFSVIVETADGIKIDRECDFLWKNQLDMDTHINAGESYGYIGNSWVDLSTSSRKDTRGNVCIRALTNNDSVKLPSKIASLTAINTASDSITLGWSAVNEMSRNDDGYRIYGSKTRDGGYSLIETVSYSDRTYTVTGLTSDTTLTPNTTYYFKVVPVREGDEADKDSSDILQVTTRMTKTEVTVSDIGGYTAWVSWNEVSGCNGYEVKWTIDNATYGPQIIKSQYTTDFKIYDLKPNESVTVTVSPYTETGDSHVVDETAAGTAIFTTASGSHGTLTNLKATPYTTNAVKLSWDEMEDVSFYRIEQSSDGSTYKTIGEWLINGNNKTVNSLDGSTKYWFKVTAVFTTLGEEISSTAGPVSSYTRLGTTSLTGLTASLQNKSMTLAWNSVTNAAYYAIYRRLSGETDFKPLALVAASNGTTYVDSNIVPGKIYYYKVYGVRDEILTDEQGFAENIRGNSVYLDPVTNITKKVGKTMAIASWDPVVGADNYEICTYSSGLVHYATVPGKQTKYTFTGLSGGTNYNFYIYATSEDGCFSVSEQTETSVTMEPKIINFKTNSSGGLDPEKSDFTVTVPEDCTYDGTGHSATATSDNEEITSDKITLTYAKVTNGNPGTFSAAAPVDAGTWQVKVNSLTTDNYSASSFTDESWRFSISPAAATIAAKNQSVSLNGTVTSTAQDVTATGLLSGHSVYSVELSSTATTATTTSGEITASNAVIHDAGGNDVTANYNFSYTKGTLTVTKIVATITTPPSAKDDLEYTGTAQDLITSGVTGDGTLMYAVTDKNAQAPGENDYSVNVPQKTDAGTYTVYYMVNGDDDHENSTPAYFDVTISKADITPTVTLTGWTYGTTANNPSVSDNPGNGNVTYKYKLSTAADTQYADQVPTGAGTYTVKATVAETDNYKGATATANFTIAKAEINPSMAIADWTYGSSASTPQISGNDGNGAETVWYKVKGAEDSTYTRNVPSTAGSYTAKVEIAESANYQAGSATADFTIGKKALTVTPQNQTVALDTTMATGINKVDVSGLVSGHSLYSVTLSTLKETSSIGTGNITAANAIIHDANGADVTANYDITYNTGTLTVTKVPATITKVPAGRTGLRYTGSAQDLITAGTASGGTMKYSVVFGTEFVGSYSTDIPQGTKAGTYTINYKVEGDDNHDGIEANSITVTISKADITPTVTLTGWTYGAATNDPVVTGNLGNASVTYTYKLKSENESAYAPTKPSTPGTYNVRASIGSTDNYNGKEVTSEFTITKAVISPEVTLAGWTYGDTANTPSVTGNTGSGQVSYYYKVRTAGDGTYTDRVPATAGDYTVKAVVDATDLYYGASDTADFTIATRPVTITAQAQSVSLNGSIVSGVSKASAEGLVDGHTLSAITLISTGTASVGSGTITASEAVIRDSSNNDVTANYNITYSEGTLTVDPVSASVTQAPSAVSNLAYTGELQNLITAGTASGGTMKYAVVQGDTVPSTYSGTIPQGTDAGTYTVYYMVEGDSNHTNTDPGHFDVTIGKADITPSVTMEGWTFGGQAKAPQVSGNPGNGTETFKYKLSTATDSAYSDVKPSTSGTYTVKATVAETANYKGNTATANFTISKAAISPSVSIDNWTYGSTPATPTVSGNLGSGIVTYKYKVKDALDSTYSTDVPTEYGEYTVNAEIEASANYLAGSATADFSISQKAVTVTVVDQSVELNGQIEEDAGMVIATGLITGHRVSAVSLEPSILTEHITAEGEEGGIILTSVTIVDSNGTDVTDNYDVNPVSGKLTVTKVQAVITQTPQAKTNLVYTGEALELIMGGTATGGTMNYAVVNAGASAPDGSAYSATIPTKRDAGTYNVYYKAVGDADHATTTARGITVTIAPATMTYTASNYNAAYDGNAHGISVSVTTPAGATVKYSETAGEEYALDASPAITDVGTKTVYFKITADNYVPVTGSKTITVTKKSITVSGIAAEDKTYDGTATATLDYSGAVLTGNVDGNNLGVTATGVFSSVNAADSVDVEISGITLTGNKAGNYVLASSVQQTPATAKISKKAVTVKAGDQIVEVGGNLVQGAGKATLTGQIDGHTLGSVTLSGDTSEVGSNKEITASNATIMNGTTNVTANYNISYETGSLTVTKKQITVSGIKAATRTYDGTTDATLSFGNVVLTGKLDGDEVTVSATGAFENASAGTNKTVNITNINLGGADASKYDLAPTGQQSSARADITPIEVTLSWGTDTFDYDGDPHAPTATAGGVLSGETIAVTIGGSQTNAGSYTATAQGLTGTTASNYVLPSDNTKAFTIETVAATMTAPTGVNLTYTGSAQALVTGGSVTGGDIVYALTDKYALEPGDSAYSTTVPTAVTVGEYKVWCKVNPDGNHKYEEAVTDLYSTIAKRPQGDAPTGITTSAESMKGKGDGSISGISGAMEYRFKSGNSFDGPWTVCSGTSISKAKAGDYQFRYKETATDEASAIALVNVAQGNAAEIVITVKEKTGGNVGTVVLTAEDENGRTYSVGNGIVADTSNEAEHKYTLSNLSYGFYSITAKHTVTAGEGTAVKTSTVLIETTSTSMTSEIIVLNPGDNESKLETTGLSDLGGAGITTVLVGGLEDEAKVLKDDDGQTAQDAVLTMEVKSGGTDASGLTDDEHDAKASIIDQAKNIYGDSTDTGENTKVAFLDVTVNKQLFDSESGQYSDPIQMTQTSNVLELLIPYDFTGRFNVRMWRAHKATPEADSTVTQLRALSSRPTGSFTDGTYYADKENNRIFAYGRLYSLYAVTYTDVISYTVTFDSDGGTAFGPQVITGEPAQRHVVRPETDPVKNGYTFAGWFYGDSEWMFDTDVVTGDMTLKAHWTQNSSGGGGTGGGGGGTAPQEVAITGITIDHETLSLKKDDTVTLTASLVPENATEQADITWSVDKEDIATITGSGSAVTVTGIAKGEAVITASVTAAGGTFTATCAVKVEEEIIEVTGITVTPETATVVEKETLQLSAALAPEDQNENPEITWTSSDEATATVSQTGLVTGVREGTATIKATITCTQGTFSAECAVTVTKNSVEVESVTLNSTVVSVKKGSSITLTATVLPEEAADKTVIWVTGNPAIATVENGVVTGVKAGTTTITATAGAVSATAIVTVTEDESGKEDEQIDLTNLIKDTEDGKKLPDVIKDVITENEEGETVTKIWVGGLKSSYPYTGAAQKPSFHVYDGIKELSEAKDYTVQYKNNKKAGTATITIKFKGNYKGTNDETVNFTISKADLADCLIPDIAVKSGENPSFTVCYPNGSKVPGGAYYVNYESGGNLKTVGEYTATFTPKDTKNFEGSNTAMVTVIGKSDKNRNLASGKIEVVKKAIWTGKPITPEITVKDASKHVVDPTKYIVTYINNIEIGTATVIVTANDTAENGYVGTKTATFKITAGRDAVDCSIEESAEYSVAGAKAKVTVTDKDTGNVLTEGVDYTVTYSKNKSVTTAAEAKIKGKRDYKFNQTLKYAIVAKDLNKVAFTAADAVGGGNLKKPKVTGIDDGKKLKEGKDFEITRCTINGEAVTSAAEGSEVTVEIKAKGSNFTGTAFATYRVIAKGNDISKAKVGKIPDKEYNGGSITLTDKDLTGVLSLNSQTLVPGKDFEIIGYTNNDKKGTAKVTLAGKNNGTTVYGGTKTISFRITQKNVTWKPDGKTFIEGEWK